MSPDSVTRTQPFDLDLCVERFEQAWNRSNSELPELANFLPGEEVAEFKTATVELIRVDMDRRAEVGQPKSLAAYLTQFPWVRDNREWLGELAFEEYRLRLAGGEEVASSVYSSTYKIDTSAWPVAPQAQIQTDAIRQWNESTLDILKNESDRLVRSVASFPAVGDRFGDFQIVEELGEGKFARVYLAQQGELADRRVALKVSAELWSESDKLARLQHTNIVPIYSIHRVGDVQALCMPFLGRETLEAEIDRRYPTDTDDAQTMGSGGREGELSWTRFGAKLADGLAHAHARKIIHRDLKPANILLSDDATTGALEPLILDFNLSENLVVGGPASLLVGGTLPYMAPEHLQAVLSGSRLSPACDIYSLGVILYQLMTGALPFENREGNFVESVMQMVHERKTNTDWRERLAIVASPDFVSIVAKCLHPSPESRYVSAEALRDDLLQHADDRPLMVASNRSPRQTLTKWCRRNRHRLSLGTLGIAAAVLLSITALIAGWQNRKATHMSAMRQADAFEAEFSGLQLGLLSTAAPDLQARAKQDAMEWIAEYGVLNDDQWRQERQYARLEEEQQTALLRKLGELLFLMSHSPASPNAAHTEPTRGELYAAAGACLFPAFRLPEPAEDASWEIDELPSESTVGTRMTVVDLLTSGNYGEASRLCREALKSNPHDESLWLCKGICELAAGQSSPAELSFTHGIALTPEDPLGFFQRGTARLELGRFSAALDDFDIVLELIPGSPSAKFSRALALKGMKQYQKALEQLDEIDDRLQLAYRSKILRLSIAEALGDSETVRRLEIELLNQTPTDAVGWVHRGMLQARTNPDGAISDLEMALTLVPNYRAALQNLAAMYAEVLKQPEHAHDVLSDWIAAYPNDPVPHASRAVLHARNGGLDRALEEIAESKRLGTTAESLYYIASAYAQASKQRSSLADQGVEAMRSCLNSDYDKRWFTQAIRDPDLVPLRDDPRFGTLFAAAKLMNDGWPEPTRAAGEPGVTE